MNGSGAFWRNVNEETRGGGGPGERHGATAKGKRAMTRSSIGRWGWIGVLGIGLAGPLAAAEIYKWVDEEGVTHYTQQPPPASQASRVDVTGPGEAEIEREQRAMEQTAAELEAAREQRRESAREEARAERQEARRAQQCAQLRENIETLADRRRLRVRDGEGRVRRLSEEERRQRLAERRAELDEHCD